MLNKNNIEFVEKGIIQSAKDRAEFNELGLQFTPYSYVEHKGEKFEIPGASPEKFNAILSL